MSISKSINVAASVGRVVRRAWVPLALLLSLSLAVRHCRGGAPIPTHENEQPTPPKFGPARSTVMPDGGANECPTFPKCGPVDIGGDAGTRAPTQ